MFPSANPVKVECRDTNSQPMQPIGFGMFHVILAGFYAWNSMVANRKEAPKVCRVFSRFPAIEWLESYSQSDSSFLMTPSWYLVAPIPFLDWFLVVQKIHNVFFFFHTHFCWCHPYVCWNPQCLFNPNLRSTSHVEPAHDQRFAMFTCRGPAWEIKGGLKILKQMEV
jgi:hypothetical protein